jgi:hypothetical protein
MKTRLERENGVEWLELSKGFEIEMLALVVTKGIAPKLKRNKEALNSSLEDSSELE